MSEVAGIVYPLDFPLKIMGQNQPGFAQAALAIVRRHAPEFDPNTVETRSSRKSTYLSLTCTIRATSRAQLDMLYRELNDHPMIVMVL